ncbi:MAG: DUF948 domain-containing protein [Propionibacteriaceae bacterium]|jgi:uncharacterized protein YoxC|nr:DUF948 domain-containing protein [Propionibacteriaceae bacterium]
MSGGEVIALLGSIAGLIAAIALLAFVLFVAMPLLKTGKLLEELRLGVREVNTGILVEARETVRATNDELRKLAVVTEDVAKVSDNVAKVSENVSSLSNVFRNTVSGPLIKTAAFTYGLRAASKGKKAKSTKKTAKSTKEK